jgi:hypothetical protein
MDMLEFEVEPDVDVDAQIDEYDLTSSPNDFNVSTIVNFIKSGAVKIPGFQRNFVWDIKRASKLIESLIIGLPVPQVFLYEEGRNSFLVIDGQQRLMSIYYFVSGRFPLKEKRVELRRIFDENGGKYPEQVIGDDAYFENFDLRLSEVAPGRRNKFHRLTYNTLGDYQTQFDLRTIRNVIVKQVKPSGDDSSIYEMFNRLNTGGVLLTPQEIRSSLYHSKFYDELFRLNLDPRWRSLLGTDQPDEHMRDIEVLLRAIAMWRAGDRYAPSMVKFLNQFSKEAKGFDETELRRIALVTERVFAAIGKIDRSLFLTKQQRVSIPLFESVFTATAESLEDDSGWTIDPDAVAQLAESSEYSKHTQDQTTTTVHVAGRLDIARQLLS